VVAEAPQGPVPSPCGGAPRPEPAAPEPARGDDHEALDDRTLSRCGAQSRLVDEELRGTVPDVEAFHFLPVPGPWPQAVRPAEPDGVGLPTFSRVKTLYYRPYPGRPTTERPLVWDAHTRMVRTRSADGAWHAAAPTTQPQFIGVCIHGRHDTCCGVRGGGLIRRVQSLVPEAPIYGVTHLGGDRFATTAVLLPSGYLLGRLDDLSDDELRELAETGLLPLAHLRGRLGATPAEAVAEIWYREKFDLRHPADLPGITVVPAGPQHEPGRPGTSPAYEALIDDGARRWRLELRREQREDTAIQYTCAAPLSKPVYHWDVNVIEETDSASNVSPSLPASVSSTMTTGQASASIV